MGFHTEAAKEGTPRLRREVGLWAAIFVTINAMVGTGIFRLAPNAVRDAGSLPRALWVWGLGGAMAVAGALCMAELGAAMPRAGGIYEMLRRAYGPAFGFWFGWTRLWLLGPSAAGSFARLSAESLSALRGAPAHPLRDGLVAASVLAGCTAVNLLRVRHASFGQAGLSALKLFGLVALGAVCLSATSAPHAPLERALPAFTGMFAALATVMWAYDGWADVASLAGEVERPARTLPWALCGGTVLVTLVYVIVNLGYANALGETALSAASTGTEMVAVQAARQVFGAPARVLLSALILTSCVGACLVGVLTGSRVFVSMAEDGLLPPSFGELSRRTSVPARAVVLTAALGIAYLSVRSFEQLTNAFVLGMFPFYALAILAVPVLRKKEAHLPRPFRAPWYPLLALVFLTGAAAVTFGALAQADRFMGLSLVVMLLGLPVGLWVARAQRGPTPAPLHGGPPSG